MGRDFETGRARQRWFLAAFALIAAVGLSGCKTALLHGLSEKEANEIIVLLEQNGITASKIPDEGGKQGERVWIIRVGDKDSARAWQILQSNNLPRPAERGYADVFTKSGLIPTAVEEKAMVLQALSGELSTTLKSIAGVVEARVHLVIPDVKEFRAPDEVVVQPSASVLIRFHPDETGQRPFKDDDIRRLVASAVEGLDQARVEVVATRANAPSSAAAPAGNQEMYEFGPLRMSADSRRAFQGMLVGAIVLMLLPWGLAAYLGTKFLGLRNRSDVGTAGEQATNA